MSISRFTPLALVAVLLVALGGSAVFASAIGLIDDHSVDNGLAEYTQYRVNDGNTESNVSYSEATGDLRVSYAGSASHEQGLLLREDHTLDVGQTLLADVIGAGGTGWDRDLGIAVSIASPTGLASGASGDVRKGYVEVSFRSNNQIVSYANDTGNKTSGQEFAGSTYGGESFNTSDPLALFITRLSTSDFEVGWMQGGTRHVLTANGTSFQPYSFATNIPGAALGYYSDVRAAVSSSPVGLDNLRLVPEPATMVLVTLGVAGLLVVRKRR